MSSSGDDDLLANVSTGTGTATQTVALGPSPVSGTYVALSPAGTLGANPLVLYNWDPATQLSGFLAAVASGKGAKLVAMGDSTTRGFGSASTSWTQLSYVAELTQALNQNGVAAQSDNFLGQGNDTQMSTDTRVTLIGGAYYPQMFDAGGQLLETTAAGEGFNFTIPVAGDYNQVTLSYLDLGSGSVTVSVDGGPALATLHFGNTGQTLTQTIDIPAGMHSEITVLAATSNPVHIQGAAFSNSTSSAIQVYNAGIDGWDTTGSNTSTYDGESLTGSANGYGPTAGVAALQPNLTIVDLGLNDINGSQTNGVSTPVADIVANLAQIIATLRAAGSDVILMIPEPFSDSAYATELPALRAALQTLSTTDNVPIIDLSATYNDNYAALQSAGLVFDILHPDATLYADIGSNIAALLKSAIQAAGAACFCKGTRIATANGETEIEALRIGDLVKTQDHEMQKIKWIGRRSYDGRFIAGNHLMLPVLIRAGAIARGIPKRDLSVSPGHAILVDGLLIPAWRLVNHVNILQAEAIDRVEYFHIELATHAIIFADGCPAESFFDDGCRAQFQNAVEFAVLYPDVKPVTPMPRTESGFPLRAAQCRLARRAGIAERRRPTGPLRGVIDRIENGTVTGWAQDEHNPEIPVALELWAGGTLLGPNLANAYRADLRAAGLGSGCHAFAIKLPEGAWGLVELRRASDHAVLGWDARAPHHSRRMG